MASLTCEHPTIKRRKRRTFAAVITEWRCDCCDEEFVQKNTEQRVPEHSRIAAIMGRS